MEGGSRGCFNQIPQMRGLHAAQCSRIPTVLGAESAPTVPGLGAHGHGPSPPRPLLRGRFDGILGPPGSSRTISLTLDPQPGHIRRAPWATETGVRRAGIGAGHGGPCGWVFWAGWHRHPPWKPRPPPAWTRARGRDAGAPGIGGKRPTDRPAGGTRAPSATAGRVAPTLSTEIHGGGCTRVRSQAA